VEGFSLKPTAAPRGLEIYDLCFNGVALLRVFSESPLQKLTPRDLFDAVKTIKPSVRGPISTIMHGIELPIVYSAALQDALDEHGIRIDWDERSRKDILSLRYDKTTAYLDLQDGNNQFIQLKQGKSPSQVIIEIYEVSGQIVSYEIDEGVFNPASRKTTFVSKTPGSTSTSVGSGSSPRMESGNRVRDEDLRHDVRRPREPESDSEDTTWKYRDRRDWR
jgi:hypothetical protein